MYRELLPIRRNRVTWDYRVVRKRGQAGDLLYAVHEVFYDEENRAWACTEEPVLPMGESLDGLRKEFLMHLAAVVEADEGCDCGCLVDYDLIPEEGAVSIADGQEMEDELYGCVPYAEIRERLLEGTQDCRCGHCLHWHKQGKRTGQCRARPLGVRDKDFEQRKRYAITRKTDWCSLFEFKEGGE